MTLFVNTKQVQLWEKVSRSTAQRKLSKIRSHFGIPKYQTVTIFEYCEYCRLDPDDLMGL